MSTYVVPMHTFYGTQQTAELLGISRRDAVRLVERGELEPVGKLPGTTGAYLFDPDQVRALADERHGKEATT